MHVELTNGNSAELRDAETFTRKERNELLKRVPTPKKKLDFAGRELPTEIDFDLGMAGADEFLIALIASWTLDLPVPSEDRASLDDINAVDAGRLETAIIPIVNLLTGNKQSPTTPPSAD